MEPQLRYPSPRTEVSGAVIEASLWLRLGFFSGVAIVAVAAIRFLDSQSGLLLSLASAVLGAALAAFSVRRALDLLERESAASGDGESVPAKQRVLSQS